MQCPAGQGFRPQGGRGHRCRSRWSRASAGLRRSPELHAPQVWAAPVRVQEACPVGSGSGRQGHWRRLRDPLALLQELMVSVQGVTGTQGRSRFY